MEPSVETTSPGAFVALAAPGEADDAAPWVARGSLLFGAGVGVLVAIGIGTAYFAGFRRQDIEWPKLAVHLLLYCVASCTALGVAFDLALSRETFSWSASVRRSVAAGAMAAAVPGAFALGHFARLRMEFIGVLPLTAAGLAIVVLFALRAACAHRGAKGYARDLATAAGITLAGAAGLAAAFGALATLVAWPSEYEAARMLMVADLRRAHLLDAFYYAVGALAGAIGGAVIGACVGLWGLGRAPAR